MNKFFDLLQESVIMQATLTVLIWGAIIYLIVTHQEVPEILASAGLVIFGYFFGQKQSSSVIKALKGG